MQKKVVNTKVYRVQNSAGFTLLEMVVSSAIIAILILALAHFSTEAISFFSYLGKNATVVDSMAELRTTLSVNKACQKNFVGKPFVIGTPLNLDAVYSYSRATDTLTGVIVKSGSYSNGLHIDSVQLIPKDRLTDVILGSELVVSFTKFDEGPGSKHFNRKMTVFVRTKAGLVDDCWIVQDAATSEYDQYCKAQTGGALNSFNPATKTCTLANGRWYFGTSNLATCPAETSLPKGVDNGNLSTYNCNVIAPGSGFHDPVTGVVTTYSDGTSSTLKRGPTMFRADSATESCHCAYGIELDPSEVAASQCAIYCYHL